MSTDAFIDHMTDAMRAVPAVRALFLSGSHAVGLDDDYSDIDFVAVVEADKNAEIFAAWQEALAATGEIVMWRELGPLINAIRADWLRVDLLAVEPGRFGGRTKTGLRPLFDHDGIYDDLPEGTARPDLDPKRVASQIEEFIRVFGLLTVAIGRHEYINGVTGIFHLRDLLVELMIAETNAPSRGGALHLNRLITDEQRRVLASLPPAVPERQAVIETNLAYASVYLPRARRLATDLGIAWPERFEAATWSRLEAELGIARTGSTPAPERASHTPG